MADTSATAAQLARILAILHIIVGCLLFCFGIADFVVGYFWTGYGCFGIWTGVWVSPVCLPVVDIIFFENFKKNYVDYIMFISLVSLA